MSHYFLTVRKHTEMIQHCLQSFYAVLGRREMYWERTWFYKLQN